MLCSAAGSGAPGGPESKPPGSGGSGGGAKPPGGSGDASGGNGGPTSPELPREWIEMLLVRIVHHEGSDRQHIFLREREAPGRSFPIVIGNFEAGEIQRVAAGQEADRPLTHRLLHDSIQALGGRIEAVEIVDLRQGTFFARLVLRRNSSPEPLLIDARPSDAIALALRARCPIRASKRVLELASSQTG